MEKWPLQRKGKKYQSHQSLLTKATKNRGLKSIKWWKKRCCKGKNRDKKIPHPKKAPKSQEFIDDLLPLLGWVAEEQVFISRFYEGCKLSFVSTHDTKYLKSVLKNVRSRHVHKRLYKKSTGKNITLFNSLYQPYINKSCNKTIKAHGCSAANPTVLPKKLKTAPATINRITINKKCD